MINQQFPGTPTSRRFVTMPASPAIVAGEPLLIGVMPCVALDSYQTATGGATCLFGGSFALTVVGASDEASPPTGATIKPGDQLYASGTKDATTNVTYGLTINVDTSKTKFGHLDPQQTNVASGTTNTAAIVALVYGF